jgi:hypothetical protein
MKYDERMDKECVALCDAMNRIPGIQTYESCCGHGTSDFRIWFGVTSLENLPILLYYLDPCHVGFRWHCEAGTDCAMSPVRFHISSECKGQEAYEQAERIAVAINNYMDANPKGLKNKT